MTHSCAWAVETKFPFLVSAFLYLVCRKTTNTTVLCTQVFCSLIIFFPWTLPYSQPNERPQTRYFHSVVHPGKLTVVNYLSVAFQARIKIIKCAESNWNARWMRAFAHIITTANYSLSHLAQFFYRISHFFFFINGGTQVFCSPIIFFPRTVPYS